MLTKSKKEIIEEIHKSGGAVYDAVAIVTKRIQGLAERLDNVEKKVDHNYWEWSLEEKNIKAIFQDIFKRFDSLEKQLQDFDNKVEHLALSIDGLYFTKFCDEKAKEIKEESLTKPKDKRTKWTAKEDTILREMKAKGHSFDEIAEVLGRSHKSVETRWHKHVKTAKIAK